MRIKAARDNIFPQHVSDIMNLMHMVVFNGTDGEEKWNTFLQLKQKEYVALGLAQYYQCEHCIQHHLQALCRLEKLDRTTLSQNVNAMISLLRIDMKSIGKYEGENWSRQWQRSAKRISVESEDPIMPSLMGLAIGIARDDDFFIQFFGTKVHKLLSPHGINVQATIGELESVVIFMKAATSKHRVFEKIERLCDSINEPKKTETPWNRLSIPENQGVGVLKSNSSLDRNQLGPQALVPA